MIVLNDSGADAGIFINVFSSKSIKQIYEFYFEINRNNYESLENMDEEIIKYIDSNSLLKDSAVYDYMVATLKSLPEFEYTDKFDMYVRYYNYKFDECIHTKVFNVIKTNNDNFIIE